MELSHPPPAVGGVHSAVSSVAAPSASRRRLLGDAWRGLPRAAAAPRPSAAASLVVVVRSAVGVRLCWLQLAGHVGKDGGWYGVWGA